jgi:hypothetical protein
MRLFLDTEFTGLHQKTTLISLALVADDGRIFYAEFTDYDRHQDSNWVEENVIPNLLFLDKESGYITKDPINVTFKGRKQEVTTALKLWLQQFDVVEIWSDVLAYDWMLFCDLFGDALSLPKNVYPYPFDICTLFKIKGIDPDISREEFSVNEPPYRKVPTYRRHNALADAMSIKGCFEELLKYKFEKI